ncbi:MAG: RraA family protein [Anaerolineae bacterium]
MSETEIPAAEMIERYKRVHTPAVADILDKRGLFKQVLPPQIQAIAPGMKVAGPVQTVKGTPTIIHKDEYLEVAFAAYMAIEPGQVAVYDTSQDLGTAHWGEMISTTTQAKGCGGAIIDGGVRDVERIIELGFPVFARYKTPADIRGRWRYVEVGVPIRIGDVEIRPGDWVLGDSNGVVVVPQALAAEVLLAAEEVIEVENKIRQELAAGEHPLNVYLKYGRF